MGFSCFDIVHILKYRWGILSLFRQLSRTQPLNFKLPTRKLFPLVFAKYNAFVTYNPNDHTLYELFHSLHNKFGLNFLINNIRLYERIISVGAIQLPYHSIISIAFVYSRSSLNLLLILSQIWIYRFVTYLNDGEEDHLVLVNLLFSNKKKFECLVLYFILYFTQKGLVCVMKNNLTINLMLLLWN